MTNDAAKITLKYFKVMQKCRKNYLEMIALALLKAVFKFLNTNAE